MLSNFLYKGIETFSGHFVQLAISVVLARLLIPEIFGQVALALIFIQILKGFLTHGLCQSIIQSENVTEVQLSTMFYINLLLAFALYVFIYAAAPLIGEFFEYSGLTSVLRVLSFTLLIDSLYQVHNALMTRDLRFAKMAIFSTVSVVIAGAVGIYLAMDGWGVWALVAQQIMLSTVRLFLFISFSGWRPIPRFDIGAISEQFIFGYRLVLSGLIGSVFNSLYGLIIARLYSFSDLAYYNRSRQLPWPVLMGPSTIISSVMFPTFSKNKNDKKKLLKLFGTVSLLAYCVVSLPAAFLFFFAEQIVQFLLGDNWLLMIPMMKVVVIVFSLLPLSALNLEVIKALGFSKEYLRIEILKKSIAVVCALITAPFGVMAMLYGQLLAGMLALIFESQFCGKLLGFGPINQARWVSRPIVSGASIAYASLLISDLNRHFFLMGLICLLIFYAFLCCSFFGVRSVRDFKNTVQEFK